MSLRTIRTPPAQPISVAENGDVFLWSDDTFSGEPRLVGDFSVGDIAHRFGYRTAADVPPSVITDAWWNELKTLTAQDEYAFITRVMTRQRVMAASKAHPMWRIHAFRTSNRLQSMRVGFKVRAFDKDESAWRLIAEAAKSRCGAVDIVDQFFHPPKGDPAYPMTVVELWWEHDTHPVFSDELLTGIWEEFNEKRYAI